MKRQAGSGGAGGYEALPGVQDGLARPTGDLDALVWRRGQRLLAAKQPQRGEPLELLAGDLSDNYRGIVIIVARRAEGCPQSRQAGAPGAAS
jgi:hypothetical protein